MDKLKCELCNSTNKVFKNMVSGQLLCAKHSAIIYSNEENKQKRKEIIKQNQERKCEICGSTNRVFMNEKTGKFLCDKHRKHVTKFGYIVDYCQKDGNQIILNDNYVEVVLRNNKYKEVAKTKISLNQLEKIKKYKWHFHDGYAVTNIDKKPVRMHRIILNLDLNDSTQEGDHKNRDTLDNRNENLRPCKRLENAQNRSIASNNTSGVTGVYWYEKTNKWVAQIGYKNKRITLGYFDDFNDAVITRKQAELKLFKDFAPYDYNT